MSLAGNDPSTARSRGWSILSNAADRSASRIHTRLGSWPFERGEQGRRSHRRSCGPAETHRNGPRTEPPTRAPARCGPALMAAIHHHGDPSGRGFPLAFGMYTRRTGNGLPRRSRIVHPHRHVRPSPRATGQPPRRSRPFAPSIALRHLSHTDQRVRPGTAASFLQRPDRGPVLLPRRLEDPAPQPRYVLLMDAPIDDAPSPSTSSGPFTSTVSNLPFRFARLSASAFKGSPAHVSAPSGPATTAGIRPVIPRRPPEEPTMTPRVSRRLSAIGIRFLGILFPPRDSAPPHDRPTGPKAWTPTGFPRSTHPRHDRIGCPLYPETSGAHTTGPCPPVAACPLCQGPGPITPGSRSHLPGAVNYEASSRVHSRSPARSSPSPGCSPDGTGTLGLHPRASHPNGQDPRRTSGRGTGIEHSPGAT